MTAFQTAFSDPETGWCLIFVNFGHHRTITNLSYAQVDADKSGAIEFDEFVLMMAKRLNSNIWSQIPTFDIDISSWANYWQNQSNNQIAHKSPNTI